jgi:hypothetical protein
MSVWRSFIFFNKIIKFEKFRLTDLESLFAHPSCRVGEESWCLNVPGRNFGHIVLCVVALLFGVFVKWIFLPITIYCSYFVGHYRLGGFYRHVFIRLYVQYVRPHIEFAVPAWSPWLEADKEVLEKVQRRAVQMVSGLKAHTYEKVLTGARYSLMRSNPSPPMRSCTKWKKLFHILRPLYYDTGCIMYWLPKHGATKFKTNIF